MLKASAQQKPLEAMSLTEPKAVSPLIGDDVYAALTIEAGLAKRAALGGTSPEQVGAALTAAEQWLKGLTASVS